MNASKRLNMVAQQTISEDQSRRTIIIAVALVAALVMGGLFYLLMRKSAAPNVPTRLANGIRAGAPDFEKYRSQIALDQPEADESKRALGYWGMTLHTTLRNLPAPPITGLQIHAPLIHH